MLQRCCCLVCPDIIVILILPISHDSCCLPSTGVTLRVLVLEDRSQGTHDRAGSEVLIGVMQRGEKNRHMCEVRWRKAYEYAIPTHEILESAVIIR